MSIYEEFVNYIQKEFGIGKGPFKLPKTEILPKSKKLMNWANTRAAQHRAQWETEPPKINKGGIEKKLPKPLKGQKIIKPENLINLPKPSKTALTQPKSPMQSEIYKPEKWEKDFLRNLPVSKGGIGSGRKASSTSKLATPKRGSPIKVAISRYQKRPSPSLHQKVVEAFRGKERKKTKIEDPLKGLKHPWD